MDDEPGLFDFLALVAVASARKRVANVRVGIALMVAMTGDGASGANCYVDAARIGVECSLSERQVWRHFAALVDDGWFRRTSEPRRGRKGEPGTGRRALYRIQLPALDLGLTSASAIMSDHSDEDGVT